MGDATPPTLSYQTKRKSALWAPVDRRTRWLVLLPVLLVYVIASYQWWSRHALDQRPPLQRAEVQFNARIDPLLQADPRFRGVFSSNGYDYITNSIRPRGYVASEADLVALKTMLQAANPPMPLDLRYVRVIPPVVVTPATPPPPDLIARGIALDELQKRVTPLLERDPRFRGVVVRTLVDKIEPIGYVDTAADLDALRKVLQGANPPVPIDLQQVRLRDRVSTTRP